MNSSGAGRIKQSLVLSHPSVFAIAASDGRLSLVGCQSGRSTTVQPGNMDNRNCLCVKFEWCDRMKQPHLWYSNLMILVLE